MGFDVGVPPIPNSDRYDRGLLAPSGHITFATLYGPSRRSRSLGPKGELPAGLENRFEMPKEDIGKVGEQE